MEVKEKQVTVRRLYPAAGHYLTQNDATLAPIDRVVSTGVILSTTDSPESWREITAQEAQEIVAMRNAARGIRNDANDGEEAREA